MSQLEIHSAINRLLKITNKPIPLPPISNSIRHVNLSIALIHSINLSKIHLPTIHHLISCLEQWNESNLSNTILIHSLSVIFDHDPSAEYSLQIKAQLNTILAKYPKLISKIHCKHHFIQYCTHPNDLFQCLIHLFHPTDHESILIHPDNISLVHPLNLSKSPSFPVDPNKIPSLIQLNTNISLTTATLICICNNHCPLWYVNHLVSQPISNDILYNLIYISTHFKHVNSIISSIPLPHQFPIPYGHLMSICIQFDPIAWLYSFLNTNDPNLSLLVSLGFIKQQLNHPDVLLAIHQLIRTCHNCPNLPDILSQLALNAPTDIQHFILDHCLQLKHFDIKVNNMLSIVMNHFESTAWSLLKHHTYTNTTLLPFIPLIHHHLPTLSLNIFNPITCPELQTFFIFVTLFQINHPLLIEISIFVPPLKHTGALDANPCRDFIQYHMPLLYSIELPTHPITQLNQLYNIATDAVTATFLLSIHHLNQLNHLHLNQYYELNLLPISVVATPNYIQLYLIWMCHPSTTDMAYQLLIQLTEWDLGIFLLLDLIQLKQSDYYTKLNVLNVSVYMIHKPIKQLQLLLDKWIPNKNYIVQDYINQGYNCTINHYGSLGKYSWYQGVVKYRSPEWLTNVTYNKDVLNYLAFYCIELNSFYYAKLLIWKSMQLIVNIDLYQWIVYKYKEVNDRFYSEIRHVLLFYYNSKQGLYNERYKQQGYMHPIKVQDQLIENMIQLLIFLNQQPISIIKKQVKLLMNPIVSNGINRRAMLLLLLLMIKINQIDYLIVFMYYNMEIEWMYHEQDITLLQQVMATLQVKTDGDLLIKAFVESDLQHCLTSQGMYTSIKVLGVEGEAKKWGVYDAYCKRFKNNVLLSQSVITAIKQCSDIQVGIKALYQYEIKDVMFFIPQLVQGLRHDDYGYLEQYIKRNCLMDRIFSHLILWNLKANLMDETINKLFLRVYNDVIQQMSKEDEVFYNREFEFFTKITSISATLLPFLKESKEYKKRKIQDELSKIKCDVGVYLPSSPECTVLEIDYTSGRPLQSHAKTPFLAQFKIQNKSVVETVGCIFKVGDDCRQDALALQVIKMCDLIFQHARVEVYVMAYRVIASDVGCGVIEVIPNAISRDMMGREKINRLIEYFLSKFGNVNSIGFQKARQAFVESMAGYSVVTYILQIKDRHNGNIMIDHFGHIVHVDFGFMLDSAPGGIKFEGADFKLTAEMVELMDGQESETFKKFVELTIRAFLALRPYADDIVNTVDMMKNSGLPCFKTHSIERLRGRFKLEMDIKEAAEYMRKVIYDSLNNYRTVIYDSFQKQTNGIPY